MENNEQTPGTETTPAVEKPTPQDFLNEKIGKIEGQIEALTGLVSQVASRQSEVNHEPQAEPVYAGDEDINSVIDKKFKSFEDKLEKQRKADYWNSKTDTEFPEIVQKGNFYNLVVQEYQSSGSKEPDAVYNAACRVFARTGKGKGGLDTRSFSAGNARLAGATPSISGGTTNSDELTPEEKYIAAKLEVSEEKYKKLRRKPQ